MTGIVKKGWGYEYCAYETDSVAIWILHIARGHSTSFHCHPNKRTRLIPLTEGLMFTDESGTRLLNPLEIADIPKGVYHQSHAINPFSLIPTSENGVWLIEIEEPNDKGDIIRKEDSYGRAGKPIETDEIPYKGKLLELSDVPFSFMGYQFRIQSTDGWHEKPNGLVMAIGNLAEYVFSIEKETTMKVSDYVTNFIAKLGIKHVFSVSGGGAMHLCDSVGKHEGLEYVATHHEQSAAMAAEAYSRINGIGCALVTTGPGGTNAITGVACAWVDSIPVLYLSGQVTRDTLLTGLGLRQFGVQESDIVTMVKSITKYAVTVMNEKDIRYELEKAAHIARSGRQGPVWVDIPLDIQAKQINPLELDSYTDVPIKTIPHPKISNISLDENVQKCLMMLREAKRPALVIGNGVRLASAQNELRALCAHLDIPILSSWTGSDLLINEQKHIGHFGIFGDRAGNFTVQNADLLIVVGCRLSVPQTGYNFSTFAREAKIVMVDVDEAEIVKPSLHVDLGIVCDAKQFINGLRKTIPFEINEPSKWLIQCLEWKQKYPVVLPEYAEQKEYVNSFYFIEKLSEKLYWDAVVVTDMGTAFTATFQTAKMKAYQRWITASGHAPMGYGLPGAIGACLASGRKKTVCIVGDGALQFNIQELQTIKHLNLPIIIFVLNNGGYLTIKHMQANHFGRMVGSEESSGVSFPDTLKIAKAYDIPAVRIENHKQLLDELYGLKERYSPTIYEIMMAPDQPLIPRLSSLKRPDGSIVSKPLEDLFPFLPRDEFNEQMIVKPVEILE